MPNEPLKRRVKRDTTAKTEVKVKAKLGGATGAHMNVWVTWADINYEGDSPKMGGNTDNGQSLSISASADPMYICYPEDMFDLLQDTPNLNVAPSPPAPGGNHPWKRVPLSGGAAICYDATRQVRAIKKSSDSVLLQIENAPAPDIPDYPNDLAEGNDDPTMVGETRPYLGIDGTHARMRDTDNPKYSLFHSQGLPNTTFLLNAQFRQYARVQIAGKWYVCSDLKLSDLKIRFRKTNGQWVDDGSSYVTGNGIFPPP